MRIHRLATTAFRNLEHDPIEFSPGINVLVGENGHGKTNVLEAIFLFKFGRSFRTARETDMIRFDEDLGRAEVEARFDAGDSETFAYTIERSGAKHIKVGGKKLPRLAELVGRYPAVLFGPHDIAVVSGQPAERRRFLDMAGSMVDPIYLEELTGYRRVLTQRNAALKTGQHDAAFGIWTEELINRGCALVERRIALVEELGQHLRPHVRELAVPYDVSVRHESELNEGRPDEVDMMTHFAAMLAAKENEEMRRRTTLVGPHRDDVILLAGGKDLRRYGSQGQRRLVAILLRLSEMTLLEDMLKEKSVLLLDDLFSELDRGIGTSLERYLESDRQIFITSPVEHDWTGHEPSVIRVGDGRLTS